MKRLLFTSLAIAGLSLTPLAFAKAPLLLMDIDPHDNDAGILQSMGYDSGSIVYFRELGSVNQQQLNARRLYEPVGCEPFYLMRNGEVSESGYNCYSFYCTGYLSGPKVCRAQDGSSYGGVVEISRRVNLPYYNEPKKLFEEFESSDRTDYMNTQIAVLGQLRCKPYYLMRFDMAVGEGFVCEQVGQYPFFSSENDCVDDWRNKDGLKCDIELREDEFDIRRQAIVYREGGSGSVLNWEDIDTGSGSASSGGSNSSVSIISFPDVIQGRYGYTAIMDLASKGIVRGYDDGTYRPNQTVNRAEFSKIFVGGLFPEELQAESECFPDVQKDWYSSYVCAAKRKGWVRGYDDGTFKPDQTMTKAEGMKIVVESLGVSLDSASTVPPGTEDGQWYSPYIKKAVEMQLILEPYFDPATQVRRSDVAVWIYRARKVMNQ